MLQSYSTGWADNSWSDRRALLSFGLVEVTGCNYWLDPRYYVVTPQNPIGRASPNREKLLREVDMQGQLRVLQACSRLAERWYKHQARGCMVIVIATLIGRTSLLHRQVVFTVAVVGHPVGTV